MDGTPNSRARFNSIAFGRFSDRSENDNESPKVPAATKVRNSYEIKPMLVNKANVVPVILMAGRVDHPREELQVPVYKKSDIADVIIVDNDDNHTLFSENSFDSADLVEDSPKEAIT